MKKLALTLAAFIATAPIIIGSGAAFATTTYTPALVKQFDATNDTGYAVDSIVPFSDTKAVVWLDNGDLWLTDGTTAGTTDITQTAADAGLTNWSFRSSQLTQKAVADGAGNLYFVGFDGPANVWKFDGTHFTQVSTEDFSFINAIHFVDGNLYVWGQGNNSTYWEGLYQVALPSGTVTDIAGGNDCEGAQEGRRQISFVDPYIVFANDVDNNCNWDLMSWDPRNPGTAPVDLGSATGASGAASDFAAGDDRYVWNSKLYFGGRTSPDNDFELWTTDGTISGTTHLQSIAPGMLSSWPADSGELWFTEYNNELYFSAYDGSDDLVYKTDGTDSGTAAAIDNTHVRPNDDIQAPGVLFNGKMVLSFEDPTYGAELFLTDGTDSGTALIKDINTNGSDGSMCWDYCVVPVAFDNHLFYVADDGTNNSVWVTDGTDAGTAEVTNFDAEYAIGDYNEFALVQVGTHLLFGVSDYSNAGGTGEMALYSFDAQETGLASTGVDASGIALGGVAALVAGTVVVVRRRARA